MIAAGNGASIGKLSFQGAERRRISLRGRRCKRDPSLRSGWRRAGVAAWLLAARYFVTTSSVPWKERAAFSELPLASSAVA